MRAFNVFLSRIHTMSRRLVEYRLLVSLRITFLSRPAVRLEQPTRHFHALQTSTSTRGLFKIWWKLTPTDGRQCYTCVAAHNGSVNAAEA